MLEIEGLKKSFGDRTVLNHLSFKVEPGEVYGLLGANGAGKTTTINIICNLLSADSGVIKINSEILSDKSKELIGIAPQENLLYKSLSCEENLCFYGKIYGIEGSHLKKQVSSSLAAVNLLDRAKSPVETLSGGMQRRINIAIALVHSPQLVILDEPTTGLDIEARYEIWALIRQLKKEGITVLLTTHLLDEAERLCDRIGILKQGAIIAEGTLTQLQTLIPAQEIVILQTPQPEKAIASAQKLGYPMRQYGSDLAFWLPQKLELSDILAQFDDIEIESISRQPVKLEHIYLEVTGNNKPLSVGAISP